MLFEPWHQYRHSLVRQLAFVLASPNIIRSLPPELDLPYAFELHAPHVWRKHLNAYSERLKALDLNPQPIQDFLAPLRSTRLGLRFEYLMWFWLTEEAYHPYRLIGHSLQQIVGRQTLGELDFLLFNAETKQIEHWEVALKYYLGHSPYQMSDWIGLNDADTLARKLNHFGQRQFQFNDIQGHRIERKYAVIKGQLYRPLDIPPSYDDKNDEKDIPECRKTVTAIDLTQPTLAKSPASLAQHIWSAQPSWIETERELGFWRHDLPKQTRRESYRRLQRHEWICPDAVADHPEIQWWTNGLYQRQDHEKDSTTSIMLRLAYHPQVPYLNFRN